MTTFWSLFIAVITIATLAGCAVLLIWCSKDIKDVPDGADLGHEIDGIRELNNPLPKWWSYMFWATIFFALFYLFAYGLGGFKGMFNWQSSAQDITNIEGSKSQLTDNGDVINQYARELAHADKKFGETIFALTHNSETKARLSIENIAKNPEALKVGQRLYLQNCSQCHGSDARGQLGFPNLTDKDWIYGGSPQAIQHTLIHGRVAVMPAWLDVLGEQGVQDVVSYTLSLSGRKVNLLEAKKGKALFSVCAACHGAQGKGNYALGAPNLTDNIWLYGSSRKSLIATVAYGKQGVMPAWGEILNTDKIDLLSAYVWSLSQPNQ